MNKLDSYGDQENKRGVKRIKYIDSVEYKGLDTSMCIERENDIDNNNNNIADKGCSSRSSSGGISQINNHNTIKATKKRLAHEIVNGQQSNSEELIVSDARKEVEEVELVKPVDDQGCPTAISDEATAGGCYVSYREDYKDRLKYKDHHQHRYDLYIHSNWYNGYKDRYKYKDIDKEMRYSRSFRYSCYLSLSLSLSF
ncbi:hypothetical protein PPL_10043 [Heterostelium album PN500]|uniref:Uncharacterized protein n=1 Tax=Heterostelium pallidum (strain ATCC 26659 / Pp 5 / PN500) TaxID=670386 RepID=D3BQ61_HETP5|nr:hypothetical protein PPL_10043 [Heterostelium album PN500]EFA76281.1 hypothetical protein PPL_10043 [Heterostelium album PN500]|eukprot:XP_020428413.1 hypothetical protein PPL_10043 [Heterostelium album PN500]